MPHVQYTVNFNISPEQLMTMNISDMVCAVKESRDKFGTNLFSVFMEEAQKILLQKWIGEKYDMHFVHNPQNCDLHCPTCKSNEYGFCRRGTITRTLKTSMGKLDFRLQRVSCKRCNKKFSPFQKIFGIEERKIITDELLHKMIGVVTELSYNKTVQFTKQFTNSCVSGNTLWKRIQCSGAVMKDVIAQETYSTETVALSDSTKVKAGNKDTNKRGLDAHLFIATDKDEHKKNNRNYYNKKILGFSISQTKGDIKNQIMHRKEKLKLVLLDGEPGVRQYIVKKWNTIDFQRCLWHINRQVGYFLWKDKIKQEDREAYKEKLRHIIYSNEKDITVNNLKKKYRSFVKELKDKGLYTTAHHLANALPDIFTFRKRTRNVKEGKWIAQSIIERAMREINRRADIGNRWTDNGAENLIRLRLVKMFQPELFNKTFTYNNDNQSNLILSVDRMPT